MQIELNKLSHQQEAINAIISVFKGKNDAEILKNDKHPHSNPILQTAHKKEDLIPNIKKVQENIPFDMRNLSENMEPLVIDVKMETGTGKTCVYTQLMYELNKELGFNKFVIAVPTTAIREGTKNFIEAEYSKRFFKRQYENKRIVLSVFEAQKSSKGKKYFPTAVKEYFDGSRLNQNKIHALLIGQGMLKEKCAMGTEFDQSLLNLYTKPSEAIAATRPIVIIDEPHRFDRSNATYKFIAEKLNPQIIIRFGATFPTRKDSVTKKIVTDYENLVYNLNAVKAFNNNLIKGVDTEYVDNPDDTKIKVLNISTSKSDKFVEFRNEKTNKIYKLKEFDDLSVIDSKLSEVTIDSIKKDDERGSIAVSLSNDLVLLKSECFYPEIFGASYQEKMIKLALMRHFETELENANRETPIKTLTLFFIDNIESYRNENSEDKKGNLRLLFEELLQEELKEQIKKVDKEIEKGYSLEWYKEYLKNSLENISKTNGGYFCKDNSTNDEDIKAEVDDILRNKEKLLSYINDNGKYNLRRFLFSKWTLKEGWDNPNVFTIAKLRSSGSEISKLQEVGRGLRLPVDINGNRINEQFYLNYITDYSEHDFAEKLINEVNSGTLPVINIVSIIKDFAKEKKKSYFTIAGKLNETGVIDEEGNLNFEKFEAIPEEYKDLKEKIETTDNFPQRLKNNKIRNRNKDKDISDKVKIRENNFNSLRKLWSVLNTKYYVKFKELSEDKIIEQLVFSMKKFKDAKSIIETMRTRTVVENEQLKTITEGLNKHSFLDEKIIPYNDFLKIIAKKTSIPIQTIHKAVVKFDREVSKVNDKLFNEMFAKKIISDCQNEWIQKAVSIYTYEKLENISKKETALTYKNGAVKEYVTKTDVGVYLLEGIEASSKFLYDLPLYDSEIEKINLENSENIGEVEVFGKIPRRSIKIPTYFGETYSPDFMYVIKKIDGTTKTINCIIETKGVKTDSDKREIENKKIACAKEFYKKLQEDFQESKINITYKEQKTDDKIKSIVEEVINTY